ncbi:MAG: hypothetical protein EA397_17175 [Deltaproteobacteria bacterium]|nr:MAG: hypothetical protein EA397_17175 [Deltaproteobacteria bacterium]
MSHRPFLGILVVLTLSTGWSTPAQAQPASGLDALFEGRERVRDAKQRVRNQQGPAPTNTSAANAGPGDTVQLQTGSRDLRQVQAPKLRSLAGSGRVQTTCDGHVFLRREGQNGHITVSRLSDGKQAGRVPGGNGVRCARGYAFISANGNAPAVVDLSSGKVTPLSFSVPGGAEIIDTSLFPFEQASGGVEALFHVRDRDRNAFIGRWRPGTNRVELSPSPFWFIGEAQEIGDELQVVAVPIEDTAARSEIYRFGPNGQRKVLEGPPMFRAPVQGNFMAYSVGSSFGVIRPDGSLDPANLQGCIRVGALYAASELGVFAGCQDRDEAFERYAYFSPQTGWRTWRQQRGYPRGSATVHVELSPGRSTVYEFNQSRQPTGVWFDMRRGALFQGSRLWSVATLNSQGQGPRLLATNVNEFEGTRRHNIELHHIDLDRGVEERLHTYSDCPGFLTLYGQHEGRFLVHCVSQPEPGTYRFQYHWSELIDVDAGTRWRETKRRHESFTPEGKVVVSGVSAGASVTNVTPERLMIE